MPKLNLKITSPVVSPPANQQKKAADNSNYEPYDFGNTIKPIGFSGAIIHIIRYSVGLGILALPYVHRRIGYLSAIAVTLILGLLYFHMIHVLVNTEYKLCRLLRVPHLTFIGTIDKTFEIVPYKSAKILKPVTKFMMVFYFGTPFAVAMDLITIAVNVRSIGSSFGYMVSFQMALTVVIIPLILLCCIRHLKYLVPFAAVTNLFTFGVVAIIVYYSVKAGQGDVREDVKPIGDIFYIPQAFGIILAAYRATGIYLPLKNEMQTPRQFGQQPFGVVNVAALIIIALYIGFGVTPYCNYGDQVNENILMNLPNDDIAPVVIRILYTLAMGVAYTLHFFVVLDTLWTSLLKPRLAGAAAKYETVFEYIVRIGLNVIAYLMAYAVPQFALLSSLSGTMGILVEVAVPLTLDSFLIHLEYIGTVRKVLRIMKNLIIIGMVAMLFCAGMLACIKDILGYYLEE